MKTAIECHSEARPYINNVNLDSDNANNDENGDNGITTRNVKEDLNLYHNITLMFS